MPDYKMHDPRGWCGDPKRGAAMGRAEYHADDTSAPVRLFVRRVRLHGDYDANGTYWGGGYGTLPLYWVASADCEVDFCVRARDRAHAIEQARCQYPNARLPGDAPLRPRARKPVSRYPKRLAETLALRGAIPRRFRPLFDHCVLLAEDSRRSYLETGHDYLARRAGRELYAARKLVRFAKP